MEVEFEEQPRDLALVARWCVGLARQHCCYVAAD